jgi:hypothetical protein
MEADNMKTYRVDLAFTSYNAYIVDAENEEDAIRKAADMYDNGEAGVWDGCDPQRWSEADMAEEVSPDNGY